MSGTAPDPSCLAAVLDRVIPADDFPSATGAGVDRFIRGLWAQGIETSAEAVAEGLAALDRAAREQEGAAFAALPPDRQDRLIDGIATAAWFQSLCELAAEGYYADPGNGANPGALSWAMIGYRHGLPEGPDGPPWAAADAQRGKLWS